MSEERKDVPFSDYESKAQTWLSMHYKSIAKTLYNRHVIGIGTNYRYKSRLVISAVEKCMDLRKENKEDALAKIRIRFHNKNKAGSKFTLRELEDFCNIEKTGPEEILQVEYNLDRTFTVLKENDVERIKEDFSKFSNKNANTIVCLYFPVSGVLGIACFEKENDPLDGLLARERERSVTVIYKIVSCFRGKEITELDRAKSYDVMKEYFDCEVTRASSKEGLKNRSARELHGPRANSFSEELTHTKEDLFKPGNVSISDKAYI